MRRRLARRRVVAVNLTAQQLDRQERGGTSWIEPVLDLAERYEASAVTFSTPDPVAGIETMIAEHGATAFLFNDVAETDSRAVELWRRGIPFATMGRLGAPFPQAWVDIDNVAAIRLALDHLWSCGHRRIGFVCAISPGYWFDERVEGYTSWAREHDLQPDHDLVRAPHHRLVDFIVDLLARPDRPTALVSAGDGTCLQVYAAAAELGLRVTSEPGEDALAVVGWDPDLRLDPPLTTLDEDMPKVAEAMWEQLALAAGWSRGWGLFAPAPQGRMVAARLRVGASG